jgi:hypothetical protein
MPRSTRQLNEWTIMCYTASDNDLSLFNVSQLKALKEAGFQERVEVLAYADSNEKGVPTRLFHINSRLKTKRRPTAIGDGEDPYVRNFMPDEIPINKLRRLNGECARALADALDKPEQMNASSALENFIGYCVEHHRAKHYLLFCMGHGLIVANDSFLFDANPASGITLKDLGRIIKRFTGKIQRHGALELLCFHSCSMSAVEVAYELKGTARYMIASEGYSYVGSWPYRQLLKKIFRVTKFNQSLDDQTLQKLVQRAYELSLYNATDYAFCGYSHDLALCDLAEDKVDGLAKALQTLTRQLKRALNDARGRELILLAHLKSQSFWREDYTDIYDFCCCLEDSCDSANGLQSSLKNACSGVINILKQQPNPFNGLIVFSDNFGWEYQYARGLSIYFPWSTPVGNGGVNPLKNYAGYAFNRDAKDAGDDWLSFLNKYWDKTMRLLLIEDRVKYVGSGARAHIFGSLANKPGGAMNKPGGRVNKPGGGYADSPCICPSIKNFPFIPNLYRRRRRSMTEKVQEALREKPRAQTR